MRRKYTLYLPMSDVVDVPLRVVITDEDEDSITGDVRVLISDDGDWIYEEFQAFYLYELFDNLPEGREELLNFIQEQFEDASSGGWKIIVDMYSDKIAESVERYVWKKYKGLHLLVDYIDLILDKKEEILESDISTCALECAYIGSYFSGKGNLCFEALFKLWENGIYLDTCPNCGGTVYIFNAGGSPLSGANICKGICGDCRYFAKRLSKRVFRSKRTKNNDLKLYTFRKGLSCFLLRSLATLK